MAGRRSPVTDIREMLRRLQLGEPDRRIARDLGMSRNTVAQYRRWADASTGCCTGAAARRRRPWPRCFSRRRRSARPRSSPLVEPFREQVMAWHEQGVEGQAIWQLLVEQHGFAGSYSSVKRFLRRLAPADAPRDAAPGSRRPGTRRRWTSASPACSSIPRRDRVRRAWVFVMTLSCSRHQYVELVFDQTVATWLRLHRAAFEFFGGVPAPRRARQSQGRDRPRRPVRSRGPAQLPRVRRALRLPHRALPARGRPSTRARSSRAASTTSSATPWPAAPSATSTTANRHLLRWCVETAGRRVHGTTKQIPLDVFDQVERAALAAAAADALGAGRVEAGQAPPRLPRRLRRRLLLGAASADRAAAVGARHRLPRSSSSTSTPWSPPTAARARASGAPSPRTCRRTRSTSSCRRRRWCREHAADDRPRLCRVHRRAARRPPARSAAERAGRPPPRPALRRRRAWRPPAPAPRRWASTATTRSRRSWWTGSIGSRCPTLTPPAPAAPTVPPRHARPWTTFFPDPGAEDGRSAMELTHQLTPMLRTLRLSGILETLEVRNRQAIEQQSLLRRVPHLLLQDEVERRAQSKLRLAPAARRLRSHQDARGLRLQLQPQAQQGPGLRPRHLPVRRAPRERLDLRPDRASARVTSGAGPRPRGVSPRPRGPLHQHRQDAHPSRRRPRRRHPRATPRPLHAPGPARPRRLRPQAAARAGARGPLRRHQRAVRKGVDPPHQQSRPRRSGPSSSASRCSPRPPSTG